MKRLGVLTVMFLAVLALSAAIPNLAGAAVPPGPDGGGYYALEMVTKPQDFVDISTTGTPVLTNVNNQSTAVPTTGTIGFDFNFYGKTYNTAFVSDNGLITFGAGTGANVNQDFTGTFDTTLNIPDIPMIGNLWDDWTTDDQTVTPTNGKPKTYKADAVYYQTQTLSDGTKDFIVQWNNVINMGSIGNNTATFEAILYENGDIKFQYNDVNVGDPAFNDGASATVGIRAAGSNTINDCFMQWSYNAVSISQNKAIVFTKTNPNPSYLYDFTYNYQDGSGDKYLGQFYSDQNYTVGQSPLANYTIDAKNTGDASKNGQVSVASYHDGETGKNFPADGNLFVTGGTTGLGSESGYIINNNPAFADDYYFAGFGLAEADVVAYAHTFTYNYSDGSKDSYTGTVYAAPENVLNAVGYTVGAAELRYEGTAAVDRLNKVDVASYHDGESGWDFPGKGALFVTPGAAGLGSESGYIINNNPAFADDYRFGTTLHLEADVVAYAYAYKFSFGTGNDYYIGTVYATPEIGYYNGWFQTSGKFTEIGTTGTYSITGVGSRYEGTAAKGQWGQVTVDNYYDSEMKRWYTPTFVFNSGVFNQRTGYLSSEYGFINITTYPTNINWNVDNLANPSLPTTSPSLPSGTLKFYFGGGYWEADVKSDNATK